MTKSIASKTTVAKDRLGFALKTLLERGQFYIRSNNNRKIYLNKEYKILCSLYNKSNKRDGTMFEKSVGSIFSRNNFTVSYNGASIQSTQGDGGIDMWLKNNQTKQVGIVQCKNYRHTIGPKEIRELAGILKEKKNDHVKKGYFVTSSKFSKGAEKYAKEFNNEDHGKEIILYDYKWYTSNIKI